MSETETDTESANEAPMDVLDEHLTEDVTVLLKSGTTYRGTLSGYDQHLNLMLTDVGGDEGATPTTASAADATADQLVIRGDTVVTVTL
jgi:small nuclear ribonucleoprotein